MAVVCIECGGSASLTDGRAIYPHRRDLHAKAYYRCDCGAYCGCHPGTKLALGNPCGAETRKARQAAHAAFDPLWKMWGLSRNEAYKWLSQATGIDRKKCHISMMDKFQAWAVVRAVESWGKSEMTSPPEMEKSE